MRQSGKRYSLPAAAIRGIGRRRYADHNSSLNKRSILRFAAEDPRIAQRRDPLDRIAARFGVQVPCSGEIVPSVLL